MELFGTKFTLTLGAWKLRFVLMLEDDQEAYAPARTTLTPHHMRVPSRTSKVV
jgi:hypothetical protein